jgi:hypothetical protein
VAAGATVAPVPRHEPEVIAAEKRRRRQEQVLTIVVVFLFLTFAVAQIGWMLLALW